MLLVVVPYKLVTSKLRTFTCAQFLELMWINQLHMSIPCGGPCELIILFFIFLVDAFGYITYIKVEKLVTSELLLYYSGQLHMWTFTLLLLVLYFLFFLLFFLCERSITHVFFRSLFYCFLNSHKFLLLVWLMWCFIC